jgi:alpha-mannosidase
MEQGERTFRFWLNAGPVAACLEAIDRQALLHNEKPMAISFYPQGGGENVLPFITLSDTVVQVSAAKKAEAGDELILRLFEPTGQARATTVSLPFAGMEKEVNLQGFEIRSLLVNLQKRTWREVNLVEKAV